MNWFNVSFQQLNGKELYRPYRVRFQIEPIFYDAKQFTRLVDCQARSKSALQFHFNASLATLKLIRAQATISHSGSEPMAFSMANRKQPAFNELFIQVISDQLAVDLTVIKNHPAYDNLRT